MLNAGNLDRHVQVLLRKEVRSSMGSMEIDPEDPYTSVGYLYCKIEPSKGSQNILDGGTVDTSYVAFTTRYSDAVDIGLAPIHYLLMDGNYYQVQAVDEAVKYGRRVACTITTKIMNRATLES